MIHRNDNAVKGEILRIIENMASANDIMALKNGME